MTDTLLVPGALASSKDKARFVAKYVPVQPNGWPLEGPQLRRGNEPLVVVARIDHAPPTGSPLPVFFVVSPSHMGWMHSWDVI